jgi:hypothetical protein
MIWRDDIDEDVASSLGMSRTDHQASASARPRIQRQTTGTVSLTDPLIPRVMGWADL